MNSKVISSWIRQARYRAKRQHIYSDLTMVEVQAIVDSSDSKCAYCTKEAVTLDCPFPLKDGCPNVLANLVPCCQSCKTTKGQNDLVWMFSNGRISQEMYLALIEVLCQRRGGDIVRKHIRQVTGLGDE